MEDTYGVDNIILDLHIVDANAVDHTLCRSYYFRTCNCIPNFKRKFRPKSIRRTNGWFQADDC